MLPVRTVVSTLLIVLVGGAGQILAQRIPETGYRPGWHESRATRRQQAAEWLKEIEEIEKQIPTLSPSEAQWLKVEFDDQLASNGGRYTPRAIRALSSREYLSREGRKFTESMARVLKPLASSAPLVTREEMRLWADLCFYALDLNSWGRIAELGDLGILARDPKQKHSFGSYQEAMHSYWAMRVQSITGNVLEPYLRGPGR
jgi:hypothetical protein